VWKSVGSFPKVSDRGWKKTYKIKLVSVFIRSLLKLCRFCCMINETTYVIPPFESGVTDQAQKICFVFILIIKIVVNVLNETWGTLFLLSF
jgi:hypothetical protein